MANTEKRLARIKEKVREILRLSNGLEGRRGNEIERLCLQILEDKEDVITNDDFNKMLS